MKGKYLLTTILLTSAITGIDFTFHLIPVFGKPASIFQAVIPRIRQQIPANLQMRLPSYLPPGTPRLYPYLESDNNGFKVNLGITPNCKSNPNPNSCTIAMIGNFTGTKNGKFPPPAKNSKPVNLAKNIRGYHFTSGKGEALTHFIFWQQNQQVYGVASLFISEREIINVANSMIKQPPIRKN